MKTRFFPYDVFLSHNANDGSHLLRDVLHEFGVRAWHDGYADMTDRRVQGSVMVALGKSRTICVCIWDQFRDSEWVQAEYKSGLAHDRVIVARTGIAGTVPDALRAVPEFNVVKDGPKVLAEFLIAENARQPTLINGMTDQQSEARIARARALRSHVASQTNVKLSLVERLRLMRERVGVLVRQPAGDELPFQIGELQYYLKHEGYRRLAPIYFGDGEEELAALTLDMLEAVSRHPHHIQSMTVRTFWVPGGFEHVVFGPLSELMTRPAHAERAFQTFEAFNLVLSGNEIDAWDRRQMSCYRRLAEGLRRGTPLPKALAQCHACTRKGFRGGGWWSRLFG